MASMGTEPDVTSSAEFDTTTEFAIAKAISEDSDLADIMEKLERDVTIDPDRELSFEELSGASDSPSLNADSDSVSTSSSYKENENEYAEIEAVESDHSAPAEQQKENGDRKSNSKELSTTNGSKSIAPESHGLIKPRRSIDSTTSRDSTLSAGKKSSSSGTTKKKSRLKSSLKALKKLTRFDNSTPKRSSSSSFRSEFTAVVVDKLPQVFVAKYLGHRQVHELFGLNHVRRPVDEMVREVKQKLDGDSQMVLPLLYVVISNKGVDLREHKHNKVRDVAPLGLVPIDFISYGVQDIKFWRVFACIVVQELSSRSRSAMCHAFLCDLPHNGRKMALALGVAFTEHAEKLKSVGKSNNFRVELRPPDELVEALEADCEA